VFRSMPRRVDPHAYFRVGEPAYRGGFRYEVGFDGIAIGIAEGRSYFSITSHRTDAYYRQIGNGVGNGIGIFPAFVTIKASRGSDMAWKAASLRAS